jgi:hypothetical protein
MTGKPAFKLTAAAVRLGLLLLASFCLGLPAGSLGSLGDRTEPARKIRSHETELIKKIAVPGSAGWVDTGLDVVEGEELLFLASGEITLQKGNPEAMCGPEGYDLRSIQQPVLDRNLGSLVGKVSLLLAVRKDEETGEEIRDELVKYFYIGPEANAEMPLSGRLYLGINENVFADNGGEFIVEIHRGE